MNSTQISKSLRASKKKRKEVFEHRPDLFAIYYFSEFMTFPNKPFHMRMYSYFLRTENILEIGFRESAKTAVLLMIHIIWLICYRKSRFICVYGFDGKKSKEKLRNIITILKTNKEIRKDFGYLFKSEKGLSSDIDEMQEQKSVGEFITTNEIKIMGLSLSISPRGLSFVDSKQKVFRPEYIFFDDVDVHKAVKNVKVIDGNWDFITQEVFGGVSAGARLIFLGNIIGEDGIIPRLFKLWKGTKGCIIDKISVKGKNGKIVWPEKIVETIEEAEKINKNIEDKNKHVISLEKKKSEQGDKAFNANFYNIPYQVIGDAYFEIVNINKCNVIKPIQIRAININGKKIFFNIYKTTKDVVVGVDVADGVGGDYTHGEFLDENGGLVANFWSNQIEPYETALILNYIFDNLGYNFFRNSLGIERNKSGIAVITKLMDFQLLYKRIYIKKDIEAKVKSEKNTSQRGWLTTEPSKEILLNDLSILIDTGVLEMCEREVLEFKSYIINEDGSYGASPGNYDDSVIARGIAVQMLKYFKK